MLRKLVTGFGVALVVLGGMVSNPGTAGADAASQDPVAQGTWVFIRWYQGGNIPYPGYQCVQDALTQYPGHNYDCRPVGDTTQLWVEF